MELKENKKLLFAGTWNGEILIFDISPLFVTTTRIKSKPIFINFFISPIILKRNNKCAYV
jgi:hypothetical protein